MYVCFPFRVCLFPLLLLQRYRYYLAVVTNIDCMEIAVFCFISRLKGGNK